MPYHNAMNTHIPEQSLESGSFSADPFLKLHSSTRGESSVVSRLHSAKWSEITGGVNTGKEGATSGLYLTPVTQYRGRRS